MGRFRNTLASAFSKEDLEQAKRYFAKAVILMACLMLVAFVAPVLPSVLMPVILMAFALVSTMGALYYTVVERLHRQHRLAADGQLSRLNRKWTVRLVIFLVAFLASAVLFVLEAPKWDAIEWMLTWLAVPLYYVTFVFVRRTLKREYAPRFYKAHAMLWSFWIVGIVLCLLYALLSVALPNAEYDTLRAAFDSVSQPYSASPSAFMSDVGKLTWYVDALSAFGISQASDWSPLVAFACRFIIYAGVFFGLVNQFGFCLLDADEVRSEFQLLPSCDEEQERLRRATLEGDDANGTDPDILLAGPTEPILSRYVLAIAITFVVATVGFLAVEFETAKAKATSTHTLIEAFVDEQTENAIAIVDGKLAEIRELEESMRSKAEWIQQLMRERNDALVPMIDEYYGRCIENIDSYLDWHNGIFGWWSNLWKDFGDFSTNDAIRTFKERIAMGANGSQIESVYKLYQERIDAIRSVALSELTTEEVASLFGSLSWNVANGDDQHADGLNLWKPLDDAATAKDVLLGTGDSSDRGSMRERIVAFVEQARSDALEQLGVSEAPENGSQADDAS